MNAALFAVANGLLVLNLVMLFVGARRPLYDRLAGTVVQAWFAASPALHSLAAQDPTSPERLAAHRAAVATAVRALTTAAVRQAAAATGAGRT